MTLEMVKAPILRSVNDEIIKAKAVVIVSWQIRWYFNTFGSDC